MPLDKSETLCYNMFTIVNNVNNSKLLRKRGIKLWPKQK